MAKVKQSRNYALIVYETNLDTLLERIKLQRNIQDYAFIVHDKDILQDGSKKPTHTHLLITLRSARDPKCVEKYFEFIIDNVKQNVFIEVMNDKQSMYEYLTHKNDPTKYQYNDTDIHTSNKQAFLKEGAIDNTLNIINDLLNGCSLLRMVEIYGREFVYKYNCYKALANDIISFEMSDRAYLRNEFEETDITDLPILE